MNTRLVCVSMTPSQLLRGATHATIKRIRGTNFGIRAAPPINVEYPVRFWHPLTNQVLVLHRSVATPTNAPSNTLLKLCMASMALRICSAYSGNAQSIKGNKNRSSNPLLAKKPGSSLSARPQRQLVIIPNTTVWTIFRHHPSASPLLPVPVYRVYTVPTVARAVPRSIMRRGGPYRKLGGKDSALHQSRQSYAWARIMEPHITPDTCRWWTTSIASLV